MAKQERDLLGISPGGAKAWLETRGFYEKDWDRIIEKGLGAGGFGSHETRALITVARGSEVRILRDVYKEMRELDGLPREVDGLPRET